MTDSDPLAHIKPGDPDPCDWFYPGLGFCSETAGETLGNACMRERGHPGQHIDAEQGGEVIATWPNLQAAHDALVADLGASLDLDAGLRDIVGPDPESEA